MSNQQNWRTEVGAQDYFLHQKKQLQVADRRPVIRRPLDLVGPGIAAHATRITSFNDVLATFNGYFSSAAGAAFAPNATDAFVGFVSNDAVLGGVQTVTSLSTGSVYQRAFNRSPLDAAFLHWKPWALVSGGDFNWTMVGDTNAPDFENDWNHYSGSYEFASFIKRNGMVHLQGVIAGGTIGARAFRLPAGYRPSARRMFPSISNGSLGRVTVYDNGGVYPDIGNSAYISLDGMYFLVED